MTKQVGLTLASGTYPWQPHHHSISGSPLMSSRPVLSTCQQSFRSMEPFSLTVWRMLFFTLGLKDTPPGGVAPWNCAPSYLLSRACQPHHSSCKQSQCACPGAGHCRGTRVLILINLKFNWKDKHPIGNYTNNGLFPIVR